jgi:hypothetical protein
MRRHSFRTSRDVTRVLWTRPARHPDATMQLGTLHMQPAGLWLICDRLVAFAYSAVIRDVVRC